MATCATSWQVPTLIMDSTSLAVEGTIIARCKGLAGGRGVRGACHEGKVQRRRCRCTSHWRISTPTTSPSCETQPHNLWSPRPRMITHMCCDAHASRVPLSPLFSPSFKRAKHRSCMPQAGCTQLWLACRFFFLATHTALAQG